MTYTIASITYLKILTKTGLMQSYLLMLFMLLGLHYRFAGGSLMEPATMLQTHLQSENFILWSQTRTWLKISGVLL